MSHSPHRGQTLVLFALCMLLLTLMVTLTLSMSMKVRERIEAQTVADATAYSNAVATARTFNNIAVLNRAQIAHAVAQAGASSLLSWASLYRAELNAAKKGFKSKMPDYQDRINAGCPCAWKSSWCARMCRCGRQGVSDLRMLQSRLDMEDQRVEAVFQGLDTRVGLQLRLHQASQGAIYASQREVYDELKDSLGSQKFANKILANIVPGKNVNDSAWVVPSIGGINKEELEGGAGCSDGGAVCDLPLTVAHAVNAAMGSRGFHFVTHRQGGSEGGGGGGGGSGGDDYKAHQDMLDLVIFFPDSVTIKKAEGTTHFGKPGRKWSLIPPYAPAVTAEDEGEVDYEYNHLLHGGDPIACPAQVSGSEKTEAKVVSSGGFMPTVEHDWTGGEDPMPMMRHMLMPCLNPITSCPGIWPPFLDYNITRVTDGDNNYGQPKNYAVVQRDLRGRQLDPWDLAFRYRLESSGPGARYDARSFALADGTPNNIQTAMATGIAYYHRGHSLIMQHWSEPPNLLNPYWRATLVAADIDNPELGDAIDTLESSSPTAADTLRALQQAGFKGVQ